MSEQRPFEVGDDVFCLMFGAGKVVKEDTGTFPVGVDFESRGEWFTPEGKWGLGLNRTLYHANSGIIKIDTTLRPELEVDAKIWVRDGVSEQWRRRHFKCWECEKARCFGSGKTSFTDKSNGRAWNHYTLTDPNGEQD